MYDELSFSFFSLSLCPSVSEGTLQWQPQPMEWPVSLCHQRPQNGIEEILLYFVFVNQLGQQHLHSSRFHEFNITWPPFLQ